MKSQQIKNLKRAFAEVLIEQRDSSGLSRMELASAAGLHLNAVGKFERGETLPGLDTLFSLADALALKPSKLIVLVQKEYSKPQGRAR